MVPSINYNIGEFKINTIWSRQALELRGGRERIETGGLNMSLLLANKLVDQWYIIGLYKPLIFPITDGKFVIIYQFGEGGRLDWERHEANRRYIMIIESVY